MYIAIKELASKTGSSNGFIVEYRIKGLNDDPHWNRFTEIQKFFPDRDDLVKGMPAILSEAV